MKKAMAILCLLLLLDGTAFAAATDTRWEVPSVISMAKEERLAVLEFRVTPAQAYAGMECGLQCGDGVQVEAVAYDRDRVMTAGPAEARGLIWFSFFAGDNGFEGTVTVTVTVSCSGQSDGQLALQYISVYTRRGGAVDEQLSRPGAQIRLDRTGGGESLPPLEPPPGAKPGETAATDAPGEATDPGGSAAGTEAAPSPSAAASSPSSAPPDGAASESAHDSPIDLPNDNPPLASPATGGTADHINTTLAVCLGISVLLNLAMGWILIEHRRRRSRAFASDIPPHTHTSNSM